MIRQRGASALLLSILALAGTLALETKSAHGQARAAQPNAAQPKAAQPNSGQAQPANSDPLQAALEAAQALETAGQAASAAIVYERGITLAKQRFGADTVEAAIFMYMAARAHYNAGQDAKADPLCQQSLKIYEAKKGQQDAMTLTVASQMAKIHHALRRYKEAEPLYRRYLTYAETKLGATHQNTAETANQLANLLSDQGRHRDAEPFFRKTLTIAETKKVADGIIAAQANLADNLKTQGKYADAEQLLLKAHKALPSTKNQQIIGGVTNNLATLYLTLGRHAEAEPHLLRSIELREKSLGKDHLDVATAITNLAGLYSETGRYTDAEQAYRRGLAIREAKLGPDHVITAHSLVGLGILLNNLSQFGPAETLLKRSLKIREATLGKTHLDTAVSLNALGELCAATYRYADASQYFRRAFDIRQATLGAEHRDTGITRNNLAYVANELGELDQAERLYRQNLAINEKRLGENLDTARDLSNLGMLLRQRGKLADAQPLLARSLKLHQAKLGKDHPTTILCGDNLAGLHLAAGRSTDALQTYDAARRASRRYVTGLLPSLSPAQQRSYLSWTYNFSLRNSLKAGLFFGPQNQPMAEASAVWLANGKSLQQEANAVAAQLLTQDNAASRRSAQQLAQVRQDLMKLKLEPAAAGQEAARQKKLDVLQSQEQGLIAALQKAGGRVAAASEWIELPALRAALPAGGVLIDIALVKPGDGKQTGPIESHYVAWVTPRSGNVRVVDLGQAKAIDAQVAELRKELAAAETRFREVGEQEAEQAVREKAAALAKSILAPLLATDEVKSAAEWVLSPEGNLWLVPWAALPIDAEQYAVERYRIRTVTTGREIVAPPPAGKIVASPPLVIADPDYDLKRDEAARLASAAVKGPPVGEQSASVLSADLRLGGVRRLPNTASEAQAVAPRLQQLYNTTPRIFRDKQALETVVKAAARPRMLILSTHGFFLPEQPSTEIKESIVTLASTDATNSRSIGATARNGKALEDPLLRCGLLFTACKDQPAAGQTRPGDDGVLTGLEVAALDLRGCELAVLSACETGLGDVRDGEGVAGLRQAFQLAGASAVLSTLWEIPDRETAELMSNFFANLAAGQPKAEALRNAQLKLIRARREKLGAAHPVFWAAFTLTGRDTAPPVTIDASAPLVRSFIAPPPDPNDVVEFVFVNKSADKQAALSLADAKGARRTLKFGEQHTFRVQRELLGERGGSGLQYYDGQAWKEYVVPADRKGQRRHGIEFASTGTRWTATVQRLPGDERSDNGLGLKLCWCPPGTLKADQMKTLNFRITKGYYLGKYEVTQGQWEKVMNSRPWVDKHIGDIAPKPKQGADYPASYVTWKDATRFCEELTRQERAAGRLPAGWEYRLPTLAQWEYGAHAGRPGASSHLNTPQSIVDEEERYVDERAWHRSHKAKFSEEDRFARRVGLKKPNAWGIHDFLGNVEEWVRDYILGEVVGDDPEGKPQDVVRTLRGGSYEAKARFANSRVTTDTAYANIGFRVALVPVKK